MQEIRCIRPCVSSGSRHVQIPFSKSDPGLIFPTNHKLCWYKGGTDLREWAVAPSSIHLAFHTLGERSMESIDGSKPGDCCLQSGVKEFNGWLSVPSVSVFVRR